MKEAAILIVQADPQQRARIVDALADCGDAQRLLAVDGAPAALDYLLGRGEHGRRDIRRQPRLVLVGLDGPAGLELLQAIRAGERSRAVPVIWLGPRAAARADQDAWYRTGGNSVVSRTDDDAELRRKLRQIHEFWLTVNEPDRDSRV